MEVSPVHGVTVNLAKRQRLLLDMFARLIEDFVLAGVKPIFVFDGPAPPEKGATKALRQSRDDSNRQRLRTIADIWANTEPLARSAAVLEEWRSLTAKNPVIGPRDFAMLYTWLTNKGIPAVKSTTEADVLCAALSAEGVVQAVLSTDSDLLVHGVDFLITKWVGDYATNADGETELVVEIFQRGELLEAMAIDPIRLVGLALYCGTDYNLGVHGIGPVKALKIMCKAEDLPAEFNGIATERLMALFGYHPSVEIIEEGSVDYDQRKLEALGEGDTVDPLASFNAERWLGLVSRVLMR